MRRHYYWVAALCVGIILILAVLYALPAYIHASGTTQSEVGLPLLAISGVVALLGVLALVALAFSSAELADPTQALGLPTGSVRAVIALSLIVLFAIFGIYFYRDLSNINRTAEVKCLSQDEKIALLNSLPPASVQSVVRTPESAAVNCGPQKQPPLFSVFYATTSSSTVSADLAKELLVLIGTLVTAVASFYFGSQAVAQAQQASAGLNLLPSLVGVDPVTLNAGETSPLRAMGTNLNAVAQVQLISSADSITAQSVTSNPGLVSSVVTVPATAMLGKWDLLVTDAQGRSDRLAQAVSIAAADKGEKDSGGGKNSETAAPQKQVESQAQASSGETAADSLMSYIQAAGTDVGERRSRSRQIQRAAAAIGAPNITVAAFLRENTPEARSQQALVAAKLKLTS